MQRRGLRIALCVLCLVASACKPDQTPDPSPSPAPAPGSGADTITLNPAIVYQTMNGWEVPVLNTVLDYVSSLPFMGTLLDQAVNDLGLNKIAIGMDSGDENPSAQCQRQYLNGMLSESAFVNSCAYNSLNDNDDPNVINPNGFHFPLLDWEIENLLLPMKQRVEARGEKLYVLLRYVDFRRSSFEHYQNPEEYAELMQVVFEHMRTKYGFVPNGIDVINEPDLSAGWEATAVGRVIARAGLRLAALGYQADFVGPSTTDKGKAVPYFDAMMAVSGASRYLKDLSWHGYRDSGTNSSATIGAKAFQYGVTTSMTEHWASGNTYQSLHQELKSSRNSSWQLGTLNAGDGYYELNTSTGVATLRPKAKYIRQYFKYIRAGARRIDAVTTNGAFDPVAFINTDGKYVVVVKANAAGSFTVGNLPAGTYGTFYTTGPNGLTVSNYDVSAADQTIAPGQSVTGTIPGPGVLTIYAKARGASGAVRDLDAPPAWQASTEVATRDGVRLRLERIEGRDCRSGRPGLSVGRAGVRGRVRRPGPHRPRRWTARATRADARPTTRQS